MTTPKRLFSIEDDILTRAGEMVIRLKQNAVGYFALEIALLLEGMAQSLSIRSRKTAPLTIMLTHGNRVSTATVRHDHSSGSTLFQIGRNQAEYLHATLLRAYRDHRAEANHIHIEGQRDKSPFDLTVMFDSFQEPMNAEEAKQRLNRHQNHF